MGRHGPTLLTIRASHDNTLTSKLRNYTQSKSYPRIAWTAQPTNVPYIPTATIPQPIAKSFDNSNWILRGKWEDGGEETLKGKVVAKDATQDNNSLLGVRTHHHHQKANKTKSRTKPHLWATANLSSLAPVAIVASQATWPATATNDNKEPRQWHWNKTIQLPSKSHPLPTRNLRWLNSNSFQPSLNVS